MEDGYSCKSCSLVKRLKVRDELVKYNTGKITPDYISVKEELSRYNLDL